MISSIFTQRIEWHGITIEINYEPDWSPAYTGTYGTPLAHLQIRSLDPECAALPITETGYLSHFIPASDINEYGGLIAFVRDALDEAAENPAWKQAHEQARQLILL